MLFHGSGKVIVQTPDRTVEISRGNSAWKIECPAELVPEGDKVGMVADVYIFAITDHAANEIFMARVAGGKFSH